MITIRNANDRGRTRIGWLDARHSFSFGRYFDPAHTNFRGLVVINDDRVAAGQGFHTHGHDNMEIVTYILSGQLAHKDSTGTARVINPGDIQHMSAGAGVMHSEFNPSKEHPVHLMQMWVTPAKRDIKPAYNELPFNAADRRDRLQLIARSDADATPIADPRDAKAIAWNADARLYAGVLSPGKRADVTLAAGRHAWVQIARGTITLNGTPMIEGDGAAINDETTLSIIAGDQETEVLIFDLA